MSVTGASERETGMCGLYRGPKEKRETVTGPAYSALGALERNLPMVKPRTMLWTVPNGGN